MLATANKIKNKTLKPVDPEYWKYDHARPNVDESTKAKTNKSALIILNTECASAETSTLKKNQNQYAPMQVKIAPTCQIIGHIDGVTAVGEEYPNIITPEPIQNKIVPYIPNTCATLLLPKPNSDVVPISWTTVFEIIAVFFS